MKNKKRTVLFSNSVNSEYEEVMKKYFEKYEMF